MSIRWVWQRFDNISASEVYNMLAIRQAVFVVEQECLYLDADNLDQYAWHLFGYDDSLLVAYARLLPPNTRYAEPSVGRVLVAKSARGVGTGRELILRSLQKCRQDYPEQAVRISAQVYLKRFYESFGFEAVGDAYDDGGILHVSMLRHRLGSI